MLNAIIRLKDHEQDTLVSFIIILFATVRDVLHTVVKLNLFHGYIIKIFRIESDLLGYKNIRVCYYGADFVFSLTFMVI